MSVPHMIGLSEAAQHIGIPYQNAHRLLLTGALRGEKRQGRWMVRREDTERLRTEREEKDVAGRTG